jgi:hypothetical protein
MPQIPGKCTTNRHYMGAKREKDTGNLGYRNLSAEALIPPDLSTLPEPLSIEPRTLHEVTCRGSLQVSTNTFQPRRKGQRNRQQTTSSGSMGQPLVPLT